MAQPLDELDTKHQTIEGGNGGRGLDARGQPHMGVVSFEGKGNQRKTGLGGQHKTPNTP